MVNKKPANNRSYISCGFSNTATIWKRDSSAPVGSCQPVEIPICEDLYSTAYFPNIPLMNHSTQAEAQASAYNYYTLIEIKCHTGNVAGSLVHRYVALLSPYIYAGPGFFNLSLVPIPAELFLTR